jgi:hypothetical protein
MVYFAAAMLAVAIALVVLRLIERRSDRRQMVTRSVVGIIVLAVGVSSMIQIYRTGDAGAKSVWAGEIARLKKSNGT